MRAQACLLVCALLAACSAPLEAGPRVELRGPATPPATSRASTATAAPPPLALGPIPVEDAVRLALENDPDLRAQRLAVAVAGTFEVMERGVFDPELFADASWFRERASQTARATGERFDVTGDATDERLGVRQRLPTGTTLELLLRHRLDVSDRTPAQNEARLGLTVTQSLLRGLGPAVGLAALRAAELEVEASAHELRAFAARLVAGVETDYWTLAFRARELAVLERSIAVAEQELSELQAQIEVGLRPEMDLAAARAELALRAQQRVAALAAREDARIRLARRLSADPRGRLAVEVEAASPLEIDPAPLSDVHLRAELATRERPEIGQAKLRLKQGRLRMAVTDNGLLPQLDAFVALGKTGFDQSLGGAFARLDGPTYDVRAGLSLSAFLGNRAASAEDLRARANARQARHALENLERLVRLEVRLAANALDRARGLIAATRATREAREAAAAAERARLEVGTGTSLLLARAERDLLESQLDELRAALDVRRARVQLYLAEGTLLARRGVVVLTDDAGSSTSERSRPRPNRERARRGEGLIFEAAARTHGRP